MTNAEYNKKLKAKICGTNINKLIKIQLSEEELAALKSDEPDQLPSK